MENSASGEPTPQASWTEVRALAEEGDWDSCRQKLIALIPANPSSILEFRTIGRTAAEIIALSVPENITSVHEFITIVIRRADEIITKIGTRFPEINASFTRIQLALAEGSSTAYVTIAGELRELCRPYRAILAASKALELNPKSHAALVTRAASYADMFDLDAAMKDVDAAEKIKAKDVYAMNTKSRIMAIQGELRQSLRIALHSFDEKPSQIGARQVGSRFEQLGMKDKMVTWYELAEKLPERMPKQLTEAQQRGLERLVRESITVLDS